MISPHSIEDTAASPLLSGPSCSLLSVILTCVLLPLGLPANAASTPSVDAPAAALVKAASGDAVRTGGIVPPRAPTESGSDGAPAKSKVEGAVGLVLRLRPDFIGASNTSTHLSPAGYLRYGRVSVSGSGGFASTGNRNAERGVATEFFERGAFRTSLGLRYDPGRKASEIPELQGLGDVRHTVRVKLSAGWEPRRNWHAGMGLSVDALGRGGGVPVDMSLVRNWVIRQDEQLALRLGVSGADQRFMRTWHGIAERLRDGRILPAYTPSGGLRDVSLSLGWRREIRISGEPFGIFCDVGVQHLLGPAADSPLTLRVTAPVAAAGLAWRF